MNPPGAVAPNRLKIISFRKPGDIQQGPQAKPTEAKHEHATMAIKIPQSAGHQDERTDAQAISSRKPAQIRGICGAKAMADYISESGGDIRDCEVSRRVKASPFPCVGDFSGLMWSTWSWDELEQLIFKKKTRSKNYKALGITQVNKEIQGRF
ncbi:hypothetical protein PENANT_c044G02930 [Penicillium antarcticum]|uniref:Uncharacterized protein n=1 Tax=Penicillium antarcticum TaxID=416450 RepID=A0A1V6PS38_9EURO|nr:hypothetical protein PENANT_c044G02930 [Penicillium antarcticum]